MFHLLGRFLRMLCAVLVPLGFASGGVGAQSLKAGVESSRGKLIAQSMCVVCHGVDGQSLSPEIPKLAGQLQEFMVLQLRNYKSGERPHAAMVAVARGLTFRQIDDVSAYFAGRPAMHGRATTTSASAEVLALGESVFMKGKPGAPACQYCHGAKGQGVAPVFARLAGQHAKFVVDSIQPYRTVDDFKNPYAFVMKAVVQNLSDAEIEAVAAYIEVMP